MKDVVVTSPSIGLLYMQVCCKKGVSDQEILEVCNTDNPCGTSLGWANVIRNDTEKHKCPVQCVDDPDREHILINC